jgi:hypothetical protein
MEKFSNPRIRSGYQYGDWTITGEAQRIDRDLRYPCQCVCGTERLVSAITLRNGSSTHCGCLAKQVSQRISVSDHRRLSAEVQEILTLISKGVLPPADQFSIRDGSPSWTLPSIARILGIDSSVLIDHLIMAGTRFAASGSEANPWPAASPINNKIATATPK